MKYFFFAFIFFFSFNASADYLNSNMETRLVAQLLQTLITIEISELIA